MNSLWRRPIPAVCMAIIAIYWLIAIMTYFGFMATDFATNTHESFAHPSGQHWLGTDIFGRDILSRALHGVWIALSLGFGSALLAVFFGALLGAIAGYNGGLWDRLVVWFYTTWDSIPYILLLAALTWALGTGWLNLFLALGLMNWVSTCRIVRTEVIKQKELDYVLAARALGFSSQRILWVHILPHLRTLLWVQLGLCFVAVIKIEVILSFLGLGMEPGSPSWGLMINDGKQEILKGFWWNILAASGFILVIVLAVNLLIEEIRSQSQKH